MRITAYVAVLAFFLAVVFVFATTPAPAQITKDPKTPTMEQSGAAGERKSPTMAETEKFSGEAKTGTSQEEKAKTETKAGMKKESEPEVSTKPKSEMRGETKAGEEAKPMMKGEQKAPMSSKPGTVSPGMKDVPKGEMKSEMGKKPEARSPGEGKAVTGERREGVREERAARTHVPGQAAGGEAVVVRIDRPENCLRIRSGASSSSEIMDCVAEGQTLHLTGVFSEDGRWAQLDNNGWVSFDQIRTDVKPSWEQTAAAGKASKTGARHGHRGGCHYYAPGYYSYPGYYYWGWSY
jgi:hypothetical protein